MNMNREQRRRVKKTDEELKYLNTPCTITEALQLARGVAEDVVSDYNSQQAPLHVAISLQVEILKEVVINAGLISEEKFRTLYMEKAEEFNRRQREMLNEEEHEYGDAEESNNTTKVDFNVNDIEVIKE